MANNRSEKERDKNLRIDINDESKIVSIWLTKAEQADDTYRLPLKEICETYKAKKYMVAVFRSGSEDLYGNTLALLKYNRRRSAEKAVHHDKTR